MNAVLGGDSSVLKLFICSLGWSQSGDFVESRERFWVAYNKRIQEHSRV